MSVAKLILSRQGNVGCFLTSQMYDLRLPEYPKGKELFSAFVLHASAQHESDELRGGTDHCQ